MENILKEILDDYTSLINKRSNCKELAEMINAGMDKRYYRLNDNALSIIEFANYSDEQLLQIAYENSYEKLDAIKEHVYVYLASFENSSNRLFPDFLVEKNSSNISYSLYGELIGSDNRIKVPIEEREKFEEQHQIINLSDNSPYKEYYDLRREYLKYAIQNGTDNALDNIKKR